MRKFALPGLLGLGAYVLTTALTGPTAHGYPARLPELPGPGVLVASAEGNAPVVPQAKGETRDSKILGDPIVIGDCRLATIYKQDVPCQRNGQLKFLTAGEVAKGSDGRWHFVQESRRG